MSTETPSNDIITITTSDLVVQVANQGYAKMVGRPLEGVVGHIGLEWNHPSEHEAIRNVVGRAFQTHEPGVLVRRIVRPDGTNALARAELLFHTAPNGREQILCRNRIMILSAAGALARTLNTADYVAELAEELGRMARDVGLVEIEAVLSSVVGTAESAYAWIDRLTAEALTN